MIPISLPYIFALSENLEPLSNLPSDVAYYEVFSTLFSAEIELQTFVDGSVFAQSLRSCRDSAQKLRTLIQSEISNENTERQFTRFSAASLNRAYQNFKVTLLAELNVLPAYFVGRKDPYDSLVLLENAQSLFPLDLARKVPEAMFDVNEASKALAFDLPTACGFHTFRVVESVLRRYYSSLSEGVPINKVRSIGVYVKRMRSLSVGTEAVLASLDQLAALHRNPLIHPEAVLTLDDALSIIGLARSVVSSMLPAIPVPALTTTTVVPS